jgi:hypothetical protein
MAEDGIGTKRENRGHPPTLDGDGTVPIGIDAAMKSMQRPVMRPRLDHLRTHSELQQLPPSHHPVLSAGQRRDLTVE